MHCPIRIHGIQSSPLLLEFPGKTAGSAANHLRETLSSVVKLSDSNGFHYASLALPCLTLPAILHLHFTRFLVSRFAVYFSLACPCLCLFRLAASGSSRAQSR